MQSDYKYLKTGDIIRKGREKAGLTQAEACKELKMSRQSYVDLEHGKREPRLSRIAEICCLFNLDVRLFFSDLQDETLKQSSNDELINEVETLLDEIKSRMIK